MEAHPVAHPSDYILKEFAAGKLDNAAGQAVRAHLEVCPACRARQQLHGARPVDGTAANALNPGDTRGGNAVPQANEAADAVPTTLFNAPPELADHPDYELLGELGRGGMGVVYLAKHRLSGRKEVLKVMSKALIGQAESKERFLREIQAAARLDHKNVVKMYTALERGELMVLVMEYVPGEDLAQVIKSGGSLPVSNACYYVQQAASGLQHAFEKGMIHRDIKPQNLILAREGKKHTVKVLDFGLAKATRGEDMDTGLTGTGVLMGTPGYVAPEQSLDAAAADIRADIYSLGCTLYHLLAGNPPFAGKSMFEIVQAHHSVEARSLNLVRAEVPEELAAVVGKMMAKNAAQRYQTPMEVVRALEPFVKGVLKPLMLQIAPSKEGQADAAPPVIQATRIEGPATIARARMKPSPRKLAPPKGGQRDDALPLSRETMIEGGAAIDRAMNMAGPQRSWKLLAMSLAVLLMLAGLAGLCAILVLRIKTTEGILVVEVNEPDADVYVDGETAAVSWSDSGQKAEIRVRPGTRKVEVKKDGFSVWGEEVELQRGQRRVLTARLVNKPPPAQAKNNPRVPEPKAPEGILIVEVNEANTDVYVDGEKRTITWRNDGKRAEIALKPGMHKVEVKKDGYTTWGEEVELQDGRRRILTARLIARAPDKPPSPVSPPKPVVDVREVPAAEAADRRLVAKVKEVAGMDLVRIPAGEFYMGSEKGDTDAYDDEKPRHKVGISRPFWLGKHKVTVGQFKRFVGAADYETEAEKDKDAWTWRKPGYLGTGFDQTDEHPVVCVSWNDAKAYCTWLAEKTGAKVRLPSEAEWEYSCRARSTTKDWVTTKYYFGDNVAELGDYAWYSKNTKPSGTRPCGQKKPNAFGLYDMHGLAWEWCDDGKRTYSEDPESDPVSAGASRVIRGGSFDDVSRSCRAADRFDLAPSYRSDDFGFRVFVSR